MSNSQQVPWDVWPSLTLDRLQEIDRIIRSGRHAAVSRYEPSIGDNPWTLGTRAYAFVCYGLTQGAKGHHASWLKILAGCDTNQATDETHIQLHFVFAIGTVPVRFYRGKADEVPSRYLSKSYAEVRQNRLALEYDHPVELDDAIRLAVETNELGEVAQVFVVCVAKGTNTPHYRWLIPAVTAGARVTPFRRVEGATQKRPRVYHRKRKDEKTEGDDPLA